MRRRTVLAGMLVLGTAALGWWSCSGSERPADPEGNDAGAAAAGGGGASGSGGSTIGMGGGSGSAAVDWGGPPRWEATGQTAAGCSIDRLTNASELRVFAWKACPWSPDDCETSIINPWIAGSSVRFEPSSSVHDDGSTVRVGLVFDTPNVSLYALDAGPALGGFRSAGECSVGGAVLWGERFAADVASQYRGELTRTTYGGIVAAALGTNQERMLAFTLPDLVPLGNSPGDRPLGTERWLWRWSQYRGYTSISAEDGSDARLIATSVPPSPFLDLGVPVSAGKFFLFDGFIEEGGRARGKLFRTDGIAAPELFLEPGQPDEHYGSPAYANSHFAFFKGNRLLDINRYESVELWASPYSQNPAELEPSKLVDLPETYMPVFPAGGWGFVAFNTRLPDMPEPPYVKLGIRLWNLAQATERTIVLPDELGHRYLGISRWHLWIGVSDKYGGGALQQLVRYRLE
jgi:hypothetical protein